MFCVEFVGCCLEAFQIKQKNINKPCKGVWGPFNNFLVHLALLSFMKKG